MSDSSVRSNVQYHFSSVVLKLVSVLLRCQSFHDAEWWENNDQKHPSGKEAQVYVFPQSELHLNIKHLIQKEYNLKAVCLSNSHGHFVFPVESSLNFDLTSFLILSKLLFTRRWLIIWEARKLEMLSGGVVRHTQGEICSMTASY